MTRLIEAEALKAQIQREIDMYYDEDGGGIHTAMEARDEIDYAPTVDAEPVRHGYWKPFDEDEYTCSVCGNIFVTMDGEHPLSNEFKYCPFCGAKMDAEEQPSSEDSDEIDDLPEKLLRAGETIGVLAEELGKALSEIAERFADLCNEYLKSEDEDDKQTD